VHALKPRWRDLQKQGLLTFGGKPERAGAFARADGSGDTVAEAAARLNRIGEVALDRESIDRLARIVAASGGPKELPVLLRTRSFMVGTEHLGQLQSEVLESLRQRIAERPVLPDGNLPAQLSPLLNSPFNTLRQSAIRLAGLWQVDALRDPIAALSRDRETPAAFRLAAIAALGGFAKQDDRDLLAELARETSPADLRLEAIRSLTRFAPAQAASAAADWFADSTADGKTSDIITPLLTAFLARKDGSDALASALEQRPASPAVAHEALAVLAATGRRDAKLTSALERAAQLDAGNTATLQDIPALAQAVRESGNAARGKSVFERPALACVNCHAIDGTPGKVGPDLGALGTSQNIEFILGAILDPQKEVKEGFVAHEIETRDGEVHQGYPRGETADEVALFDHLAGRVVRFRTTEIASRRQVGSLMPPGLAAALTRDDFRDLVAYLSRLGRRD
jgi:putative heme-binding domain-containing protein